MAISVKDKDPEAAAKKSKAAASDTPSGQALEEVGGRLKEGASKDAQLAHAAKYEAAKRKHRWG